jgi:formylglycine-generating enzyme required for sulfatase activity
MAWIPGGEFLMGSEDFYPEERPVHRVVVDAFWMDERPVTAAEFRRFVRETGYVTVAERPLDAAQYPDADPKLLVPGSLVFRPTRGPEAALSGESAPLLTTAEPRNSSTSIHAPYSVLSGAGRSRLCVLAERSGSTRATSAS